MLLDLPYFPRSGLWCLQLIRKMCMSIRQWHWFGFCRGDSDVSQTPGQNKGFKPVLMILIQAPKKLPLLYFCSSPLLPQTFISLTGLVTPLCVNFLSLPPTHPHSCLLCTFQRTFRTLAAVALMLLHKNVRAVLMVAL